MALFLILYYKLYILTFLKYHFDNNIIINKIIYWVVLLGWYPLKI